LFGSRADPCEIGCPARRAFLKAVLATGLGVSVLRPARGDEEKPGSIERVQTGDLFVYADGDSEGDIVTPAALRLDEPQVLAWPMDPTTKVVRDGSRLSQLLLLHLNPETLDEDTRPHAADGIVAYSAICTHAGCPVTGWVRDQEMQVLKCFCHNSEFDPRRDANVVFGPAPRRLAALPVKIVHGALIAASKFVGRVGAAQQG